MVEEGNGRGRRERRGREREWEKGGENRGGKVGEMGERGGERERRGRGREGKNERKREERKEELKIGFWNVAGVKGKDEDFWEKIREWDVIGMMETWIEECDWEKWEEKVPKE